MSVERFEIDPAHSTVGFTVRHLVITKVHGRFGEFSGTLEHDAENPAASKVAVTIRVPSIDTRDEKRDAHLRSADFFDADNHPEMKFESTKVEASGSDYRIFGDLTIRGVTKAVVLESEYLGRGKDPWGGERVGFSAKTKVDRKDFGLVWNVALETGGVLVGESVEIELDVQARKA